MAAHNIISGTVTNRRDHIPASVTAKRVAKRVMIIAAAVLGVMLALGLTINAMNGELTSKRDELPACKYEDDHACYWDADTMGNGQGMDVVNR